MDENPANQTLKKRKLRSKTSPTNRSFKSRTYYTRAIIKKLYSVRIKVGLNATEANESTFLQIQLYCTCSDNTYTAETIEYNVKSLRSCVYYQMHKYTVISRISSARFTVRSDRFVETRGKNI